MTSFTPTVASAVKTVSTAADYTVLDTDGYDTVYVTHASSRTVTLPVAANNIGRHIKIFKGNASGTYTLTLARQSSDTIDGATSYIALGLYDMIEVTAVASAVWVITDKKEQPVVFAASLSASQSIATATNVLLAMDTENIDTHDAYTNTASNYKFTAPTTGRYWVSIAGTNVDGTPANNIQVWV